MWAWDAWYVKDGDTYHAFYLEAPSCLPDSILAHAHSDVGHATSSDLVHWENQGPAVVAVKGSWNDRNIATGSVGRGDDAWWMVFTAYTESGKNQGFGLARSPDLMHWKKIGDGPVIALGQIFESNWNGKTVQWSPLADPFLYPEKVYGYHYIFVSSHCGVMPNERGCVGLLRSADLVHWDPAGIVALPGWFDRTETPQVWQRNGRWYLYFAAAGTLYSNRFRRTAPPQALDAMNFVFMADRFEGPYGPVGKWWLHLPDGLGFYGGKIMPGPDLVDRLLPVMSFGIASPYPIQYGDDGSPKVGDRNPN